MSKQAKPEHTEHKPEHHDEPAAEAAPKAGGSLFGKALVGLFIGSVILLECALAYLLIPGPAAVSAHQTAKPAEHESKTHEHGEDHKEKAEETPVEEVDLGNYGITIHQPNAGTTLRIDFHLIGTVGEGESESFKELFERNKHRFREQILFEVRNADVTDLTDPGLGLIKRRILEKSNTLLGKAVLKEVVFSDFSFIEQ